MATVHRLLKQCNCGQYLPLSTTEQLKLLLETQVKARRIEEIFGKQQFQTLTENWHGKNGRERQVYTTITDFLNQKFVNNNTHKRYTGLWIFSRLNSLGKTALLRTLAEIVRIFFHQVGDSN